jgi:HAE1 family hydrophobic/amphiphilic exporter-1
LFITHTPLSVVAYLGIIMLGGIAVNNGIVLIDLVNNLRKEGYSAYEAVVEASKTRLRPILMTSLTTILGLLPLALGIGEGAELQAPLALTVMGGLTSATFLTLVFIPAVYLIVSKYLEARPAKEIPVPLEEIKPEIEPKPSPAEATLEVKPVIEPKPELEALPTTPIALEKKEKERIVGEQELNPRQKELLEKLKDLKKITRKDYAQMFGISIPTASRDLKELVDKKMLRGQGPLGPGRWYELV